ncbi:hypothetical protein [Nonomuraea dietziae]|uniref:hypothetical protein n=1 Tax=Nonomuraea dietziae TaxID=65515 RepID=UPI0033C696DB
MSDDAPELTAELVADGVVPSQPVISHDGCQYSLRLTRGDPLADPRPAQLERVHELGGDLHPLPIAQQRIGGMQVQAAMPDRPVGRPDPREYRLVQQRGQPQHREPAAWLCT